LRYGASTVTFPKLTPKQLDELVWFVFSLAGVGLIGIVWAYILPMFAASGARGANLFGLALTYLVAVFGGASGVTMAQPNGNRALRWLGWAALLAILLMGILFAEISNHCAHASCRIGCAGSRS
jgi:hypothetical protein